MSSVHCRHSNIWSVRTKVTGLKSLIPPWLWHLFRICLASPRSYLNLTPVAQSYEMSNSEREEKTVDPITVFYKLCGAALLTLGPRNSGPWEFLGLKVQGWTAAQKRAVPLSFLLYSVLAIKLIQNSRNTRLRVKELFWRDQFDRLK